MLHSGGKSMKRNCFVIGIILLFIGANATVAGSSVEKKTMCTIDPPMIDITPDDGLYWNDHKIAEYPVPLFLHYYFKIWATIPIVITIETSGDLERIEIYINELLQETIYGPGPVYSWSYDVTITPFHHSQTFGIKLFYFDSEEVISDNVTISRLFP